MTEEEGCCGPPHCGAESAKGRTVETRRRWSPERQEEDDRGTDRGCRVQCVGGGPGDREAGGALARGVDVQLALENVVDDRLGQVIHDMAVPVLQGQPA